MVRLKDFKLDPSKGKVLEGRHIAGTEIAGQHRVAGEFRLKAIDKLEASNKVPFKCLHL